MLDQVCFAWAWSSYDSHCEAAGYAFLKPWGHLYTLLFFIFRFFYVKIILMFGRVFPWYIGCSYLRWLGICLGDIISSGWGWRGRVCSLTSPSRFSWFIPNDRLHGHLSLWHRTLRSWSESFCHSWSYN